MWGHQKSLLKCKHIMWSKCFSIFQVWAASIILLAKPFSKYHIHVYEITHFPTSNRDNVVLLVTFGLLQLTWLTLPNLQVGVCSRRSLQIIAINISISNRVGDTPVTRAPSPPLYVQLQQFGRIRRRWWPPSIGYGVKQLQPYNVHISGRVAIYYFWLRHLRLHCLHECHR